MTEPVVHQLLTQDLFQIEVIQIGNGDRNVIAFHGFGRSGYDWKLVYDGWGKNTTLFAVNLYFHGESMFPANRSSLHAITKTEFHNHMQLLLAHFGLSKVSLAGYSLGGKIALTFAELLPESVSSIWLFAPDGIRINPWYQLATKTRLGRKTYALFLDNPTWLFKTVDLIKKARIIDEKIERFALENIDSSTKRMQVKDVWLALRFLNPNLKTLRKSILEFDIKLYQFYGKYDSIIPLSPGKRFAKAIHQEENVFQIECGHWLFRDKTVAKMKWLQTEKGC